MPPQVHKHPWYRGGSSDIELSVEIVDAGGAHRKAIKCRLTLSMRETMSRELYQVSASRMMTADESDECEEHMSWLRKSVGKFGEMAQPIVTAARARRLLIEQGYSPVGDKKVLREWTLGSIGGILRRMGSKPTLALRQAIFGLEREGKLLTSGLHRPEPEVTVKGVSRNVERWCKMRL